ncbi:MAG TPA: hypothetical protein VFN78_03005 [Ktedonobacterales bacterium]|nr:hypothetical protein [Ktedonobacterales bacterium]
MHPEDALDVLLTERANNRAGAGRPVTTSRTMGTADETLRPLVAVAARLDPLADAAPSAAFTADLEQRLMARMRERVAQPQQPMRPAPSSPAAGSRRTPVVSGILRGVSHPAWAGIAAALLLTIGLGVFTAQAAPGQPFYTVRQLAQRMAAQAFPSPTVSVKDALAHAQADLSAYNAAIARGDTSAALGDLRSLRADDAEAATVAIAISDPGARQTASQQVTQFREAAAVDLRQSLAALDWRGRAQVTNALRAWGDTSLVVTDARIVSDSTSPGQGQHDSGKGVTALLQVAGAGFADGSQVLVNGQPVGSPLSQSPTLIRVRVQTGDLNDANLVIAVEESDGTVAIAARIDDADGGQPGAVETPGSGDNKGDQGAGSGSSSTPNATSSRTPSPESTDSANSGISH